VTINSAASIPVPRVRKFPGPEAPKSCDAEPPPKAEDTSAPFPGCIRMRMVRRRQRMIWRVRTNVYMIGWG
jgi:hypothetical protein